METFDIVLNLFRYSLEKFYEKRKYKDGEERELFDGKNFLELTIK